jgi:hypothetical protein
VLYSLRISGAGEGTAIRAPAGSRELAIDASFGYSRENES